MGRNGFFWVVQAIMHAKHWGTGALAHLGVMVVTLFDCVWQCQMLCDAPSGKAKHILSPT